VTKQSEGHLTTEQLSALLDKQLSAQEQAIVDAHLQTCQQCRLALAELRQTVVMLRALPQVEVPRSFTLPARLAIVQESPAPGHAGNPAGIAITARRRARRNSLQLVFRAVSTLAAVLGLILILSFFATALPNRGATNMASSGSAPAVAPGTSTHNASTATQHPTTGAGTQPGVGSPSVTGVQTPTPTPTPPQVVKSPPRSTGPPVQPSPAVFDLSTPSSHLVIGSVLLVLSILGFALTRRR
jgi:hypothetical protein